MALRLSRLFGNSPEFWLNAKRAVDLWEAARTIGRKIEKISPVERGLNDLNETQPSADLTIACSLVPHAYLVHVHGSRPATNAPTGREHVPPSHDHVISIFILHPFAFILFRPTSTTEFPRRSRIASTITPPHPTNTPTNHDHDHGLIPYPLSFRPILFLSPRSRPPTP